MAWVDRSEIEHKSGTARPQPTHVVAHVKIFDPAERVGDRVVQIDTFGSDDRKNLGKQSQILQLGREAAGELFSLLKDVYDFR